MSNSYVFRTTAKDDSRLILCEIVELERKRGTTTALRKENSRKLVEEYGRIHPTVKLLDVSRSAEDSIGIACCGEELILKEKQGEIISWHPVEKVFYESLVFEKSGVPDERSRYAEKLSRKVLRSGNHSLCYAEAFGERFGAEAFDLFYDWLGIRALMSDPFLAEEVMLYDAFVDSSSFGHRKGVPYGMARSCALYVNLRRKGLLEEAMRSAEDFVCTVRDCLKRADR